MTTVHINRRFAEFCDACRRDRYIGLCYGAPDVGKTLSARHYARSARVEPYLDEFADAGIPPPELADCRAVVYTPEVATTPRRVAEGVHILGNGLSWVVDAARHPEAPYDYGRLRPDPLELLIVDEADRLKLPALEQLRDTYDRGRLELVLIGMPGLEKRLARYAQLYSRVGFARLANT